MDVNGYPTFRYLLFEALSYRQTLHQYPFTSGIPLHFPSIVGRFTAFATIARNLFHESISVSGKH